MKFLSGTVYESLVNRFQDVSLVGTPAVRVRMIDISRHFTRIKLRNINFEADEEDIRRVFEEYGTVHLAQHGKWVSGAYAGLPEGTFTLKIILRHPIPSYVYLQNFKTQVMISYAGQKRTCRLCGEYDHIAVSCGKRQRVPGPAAEASAPAREEVDEGQQSEGGCGRLWSKIVDGTHVAVRVGETLGQLTGPETIPVANDEQQVQEEVLGLEEELAEVLKSLSPPEEADAPEGAVDDELKAVVSQRQENHKDYRTDSVAEMSLSSMKRCTVEV